MILARRGAWAHGNAIGPAARHTRAETQRQRGKVPGLAEPALAGTARSPKGAFSGRGIAGERRPSCFEGTRGGSSSATDWHARAAADLDPRQPKLWVGPFSSPPSLQPAGGMSVRRMLRVGTAGSTGGRDPGEQAERCSGSTAEHAKGACVCCAHQGRYQKVPANALAQTPLFGCPAVGGLQQQPKPLAPATASKSATAFGSGSRHAWASTQKKQLSRICSPTQLSGRFRQAGWGADAVASWR